MCRHLAYVGRGLPLADLVTAPGQGLYEQSWAPRRQRHGVVNADGFGLGWYPEPAGSPPARYRRSVPIWADPNLADLLRTLHSGTVVAAVRDATPGTAQDETAAAPYSAGDWLFSHNGAIPGWQRLPQDLGVSADAEDLLTLESRCDSALLWYLLLRGLRTGAPMAEAVAALVRRIRRIRPGVRLNLLLTDGRSLVATRCGDTLWCRQADGGVLVASEPDVRQGWQEVPDDTVLVAGPAGVRTAPLSAPASDAVPRTAVTTFEPPDAPVASASERNPTV